MKLSCTIEVSFPSQRSTDLGVLVWVRCGSWAAWLTWKEPVQGRRQEAGVQIRRSCLVVIQDEVPGEVVIVLMVDNAQARKPNRAFIPDPRGPRAPHVQVSLACPQ